MLMDNGRILEKFNSLEDNWNSYNATAPTDNTLRLVKAMNILPTSMGGLVFEANVNGYVIEVEFGPDGSLESTYCSKDS
jgi:hypothetical protein